MKKYINYIILIIISLFININCFASSKTYVRTTDNLRVPNDVIVDNDSIDKILKTPSVSSDEKIYDFANVLSKKEEKKIFDKINSYINYSENDCVIVITNDLKGFNITDYTYNFYDFNDFKDDGLIFVIYVDGDYNEIFMGTSGHKKSDVFKIYDNKIIDETMKYLYHNYIIKKNYYEASYNFVEIVGGLYIKRSGKRLLVAIPFVEVTILSFAITFIVVMILLMKSNKNKKKKYSFDDYVDKDTLVIKMISDDLINTSDK